MTKKTESIKAKTVSPIVSRSVKGLNRLLLFVRAGGKCEFDGCNRDVLKHHVTLKEGNFGEMAHIVAFKPKGPRGQSGLRPNDINEVRNLMLMCPSCHKHIDDNPDKYSKRTLEEYKRRHEKRIRYVTALGPDRTTTVLTFKSLIAGQLVQVPFSDIIEATAPLYPSDSEPTEIDLTAIKDDGAAFIEVAKNTIGDRIRRFFEPGGEGNKAKRISVFALAPIPLLMFLGRQLTSKVPVDVYQRHRDKENWTWKTKGASVEYVFQKIKDGKKNKVALVLSLSGSIPVSTLPKDIRDVCTIYEITLSGIAPNASFLRMRQDLENFRTVYQQAIGTILKNHGIVKSIALFPAIPAPVAILCGRELLPKVHPNLRIFDYNKNNGGYAFAMEI